MVSRHVMDFLGLTEKVALSVLQEVGRLDQKEADRVAVDSMRRLFNAMPVKGVIVVGEGERDEAPMLYVGEQVGRWSEGDAELDIAVDPLECTKLCAYNQPSSSICVAFAPRGSMVKLPDVYMQKLAVRKEFSAAVDINNSTTDNILALARAKGCDVRDVTVLVLDRKRHSDIMRDVINCGARLCVIEDGDVHGVLSVALDKVDMYLGIGGAPECVLAAAALRACGGHMQSRLAASSEKENARIAEFGLGDAGVIYNTQSLVAGDAVFVSTFVTGDDAPRREKNGTLMTSIITDSSTQSYALVRRLVSFY